MGRGRWISPCISGTKAIAGIILTNDNLFHPRLLELPAQTDIPMIAACEDAYTITSKINATTVRTQPQDTDKIPIIRRLTMGHVDMNKLLAVF